MAAVTPYIIRHIRLDKFPEEETVVIQPGSGYYLSCWWKQIPLGQLFIEHHEEPGITELTQRILQAIEPAVDFYLAKAALTINDYKGLFLQKRYKAFALLMEDIFSAYSNMALPCQIDISVIICTRNRSNDLQRCLRSLFTQTYTPREIIVVDNAPFNDATRYLVEQYKQIIYCREPRGGLSIARNTGLRVATSSIVAFTDDDVLLHPLWLYHVWQSFLSPGVVAMTGLVIPSVLETQSQQLFEKQWSFNSGYRDKLYDNTYFRSNLATGPRVWDIGAGANMAFRRSVFTAAGYFDERLGAGAAGCSEDSEMWYRILAAGFDIHYNPRAAVYHEHRKELHALYRQIFSYMRGHAAAALIQQTQHKEAGYRRYLYRKVTKSYLPLLIKSFFRYPFKNKMLFIQLRGLLSGIFFFVKNRHKPSQTNPY